MLVARELEILAHRPKDYWRIEGSFSHNGNAYTGVWFDPQFKSGDNEDARDDRIFDEARAQAIVEAVAGQSGLARETRKPSREAAPPLFDLTSLQREANRRFGWSARRALSAAQRCYEIHKILTYPRTDSRCLPNDYRAVVDEVIERFANAGNQASSVALDEYAESASHLIQAGRKNEARVFDDSGVSDHFAIVPTGQLPGTDLSGDDQRLFDLVVRRFLGTFSPPAIWQRVERVTEVNQHHFRTRARTLEVPGWRAVLGTDRDEDISMLPALVPGSDDVRDVAIDGGGAESQAEQTQAAAAHYRGANSFFNGECRQANRR